MRISLALILTLVALGALWAGSGEARTRGKIFDDDICREEDIVRCEPCCRDYGYEESEDGIDKNGRSFCRCVTYDVGDESAGIEREQWAALNFSND